MANSFSGVQQDNTPLPESGSDSTVGQAKKTETTCRPPLRCAPSRPLCEEFQSPFAVLGIDDVQILEHAYECWICQNGRVLRELIRLIVRSEISDCLSNDLSADVSRSMSAK